MGLVGVLHFCAGIRARKKILEGWFSVTCMEAELCGFIGELY